MPEIEGQCWREEVQQYIGYFQGSICATTDLLLAIFPTSLFWSLRMEWKVKLSLSILMGLGLFAMIAAIIKTAELQQLTKGAADPTYNFANFVSWWTIEGWLVLIAACIPTLRPIFRRTGNTTHDSTIPSNKLSTWIPSKPVSKTQNLTIVDSSDERPFFELGTTTPPTGDDSHHDRKRYRYSIHTGHHDNDRGSKEISIQVPSAVVGGAIRKHTTTEVMFADAVSLKKGTVGRW